MPIESRTWVRLALGVLAIAAVLLALRLLPAGSAIEALASRVREAGPSGPLLFGAAYVLATVLLVPASLLTLAAGFLWGPLAGAGIVWPAAVAGATLAFLAGRTIARGAVERRIGRHPLLRAVSGAMGEHGLKVTALLRLSPVLPFGVLNYALGLTRVSLWRYVAGSAIGMLPGTFLYVYLGSLGSSLAEVARTPGGAGAQRGRIALLALGLVATALATWVIGRAARRALPAMRDGAASRASHPRGRHGRPIE